MASVYSRRKKGFANGNPRSENEGRKWPARAAGAWLRTASHSPGLEGYQVLPAELVGRKNP
jgi:hypothetical protein